MKENPEIDGPLGRPPRRLRAVRVRVVATLARAAARQASRIMDIVLATALFAILSPLLVLRASLALRSGRLLDRQPLVGRLRAPFDRLSFAGPGPGRSLPVVVNILRGDMAFAGPRPLTLEEAARVGARGAPRFEVRPGLVSFHTLRQRLGIAHNPEAEADRELVYAPGVGTELALLARAVPGALLGGGRSVADEFSIFGVRIVNTTMDEALDWMLDACAQDRPVQVAFVNPDCLNTAYGHAQYRAALAACARVLPDGIGVNLACRILGTSLVANTNGTDMFPLLCERLAASGHGLYLLGARPGVAEAAGAAAKARFPALKVLGVRDGYFAPEDEDAVVAAVNASGASVLLVAFGAPRQDLWLADLHDRLRPAVRMGVGGLFDFYSGRIPRAPIWLRELGLEWVYRLLQEPGRMWRRYVVGNPLFLARVLREALRGHDDVAASGRDA